MWLHFGSIMFSALSVSRKFEIMKIASSAIFVRPFAVFRSAFVTDCLRHEEDM